VADLLYRVLALILFRPWDFHGRRETGLTLHCSHWSYSLEEITNGIITLETLYNGKRRGLCKLTKELDAYTTATSFLRTNSIVI
jgi:hypothetical protein